MKRGIKMRENRVRFGRRVKGSLGVINVLQNQPFWELKRVMASPHQINVMPVNKPKEKKLEVLRS